MILSLSSLFLLLINVFLIFPINLELSLVIFDLNILVECLLCEFIKLFLFISELFLSFNNKSYDFVLITRFRSFIS